MTACSRALQEPALQISFEPAGKASSSSSSHITSSDACSEASAHVQIHVPLEVWSWQLALGCFLPILAHLPLFLSLLWNFEATLLSNTLQTISELYICSYSSDHKLLEYIDLSSSLVSRNV